MNHGGFMKAAIFILAMGISTFALAQTNSVSTNASSSKDYSHKGFYVGADYMNVTDIHISATFHDGQSGTSSSSSQGGTHLGMAGATLGYDHSPEQGLGYRAGLRLLEAFNQNEYGDDKVQMFIPEANLTFCANRYILGYAGINAAVWEGSSVIRQYKTRLGGQFGLGVRFTKNVAMNAGYTMMNQRYESKDFSGSVDLDVQFSGFNSNLTYTF